MDTETRDGLLLVLLSTVGYAMLPTFTKFIYANSTLQPLDIASWRFTFAVPVMWVLTLGWERHRGTSKIESRPSAVHLTLSGLLITGAALTAFYGLSYLPASTYVVLFFSYPAMVGIMTAVMGEPLPLRGWFALGLTLLGIAFTAPDLLTFSLSGDTLIGFMIAILNALLVALWIVLSARIQRGHRPTVRASAWTITGALMGMLPVILFRAPSMAPTTGVWMLLIGLAAFSTVMPVFGLMLGTAKLGAARAAIVGTVEPVMAIGLAALLLGERLLFIQVIGAVLIISSVVLLEARPIRKPRRSKQLAAIKE